MSFGPVLVTGAIGRQGRPLVIVVAELRHRLADPAYRTAATFCGEIGVHA